MARHSMLNTLHCGQLVQHLHRAALLLLRNHPHLDVSCRGASMRREVRP
jgi:hypothetical protein